MAKAHGEAKVFVYVTNAEREYLIWKQVKEASGQLEANKVARTLRDMHKDDRSVEELSREDAALFKICKTDRFRKLISWTRSSERSKSSAKKEEPDLRNFLSNPPSRPGDGTERKKLPDLREVLEDRPPKRSSGQDSKRDERDRDRPDRGRSDRRSRTKEDDRKRRRSNERSTRSGSRSERDRERDRDPYDCLNFPHSKLKRFQKWNDHLEEFNSSVWPLVRQNACDFMDVIEECFKIQGVKHLICLVFLPQEDDEDLETWRGKIQSVFTEGSRMQLGFVAEMSWLNKGDDIHCVRIRNSKNYSRTVYIIQHPSQLLAENIPQQLHSIYITKVTQPSNTLSSVPLKVDTSFTALLFLYPSLFNYIFHNSPPNLTLTRR